MCASAKARPQRKTEKPQRRASTKSRQSGQKAPHHDAKRREPKKDQAWRAKEAERGRTTQGGLQGARPSQVAKAKGTRDCATSTQRVAPHKAEREIKGHVGDRVSDVVRRVAREFGKEVHNLFGESPMCFEPKWDKVVSPFVCVEEVLVVFDVAPRLHS